MPIRIPLSMPNIGGLERQYVDDAIAGGWISGTGPYITAFEDAVRGRLDRSFVVAMSSGTQALEITLQALGIGEGDEVIVPALTFAAPAAAVVTAGALPIFADVTASNWTINPAEVARLITSKTKAIIAVDVMGHPCDFSALQEFEVPIIEDAAEAHGSRYKGKLTGSFGVVSIFSFHANKVITTGEGGCVATDDAELAAKVRLIANHGMTPNRPYHHDVVGRNGRMTNLAAAVGLAQMERWDELIAGRIRAGRVYEEHLASAECKLRPADRWVSVTPWLQTVLTPNRDDRVTSVRQVGIDARAIWPAISDLPLYLKSVRRPCPVASYLSSQGVWLPTWSNMSNESIIEVVQVLEEAQLPIRFDQALCAEEC